MPYSVQFTTRARRDFSALEGDVQRRLSRHIDRLAVNPLPPGCKKLQDDLPFYRLRVGDYRIIYQIETNQLVVIVVKIGHRREVYR
jgi:mRNA interferase RelE/StbE